MAITQIEVVKAVSNGATPGVATAAFGTTSTSGELLVALYENNGDGTLGTVTDNLSQTWTVVDTVTGLSGGHYAFGFAYKKNSASGVTQVKYTNAGSNVQCGLIAAHYTGIDTASPLDQHSVVGAAVASPWSSGNVTTLQASELLIGYCYGRPSSGSSTPAKSGSWIQDLICSSNVDGTSFDANNGGALIFMHQIVSSTQTNVAATGTDGNGGTIDWPGIATFKAAAAGFIPPIVAFG